jgi:lysyl-tRNA synthetase class 2
MRELAVRLEADFLDRYPEASIHTLMAEGVDRIREGAVEEWKSRAIEAVKGWNIDPQRLVEEEWIAEWRAAIRQMGLNPAKTRSSIEQLAKRALAGKFLTTPIPLVNLYCHISTIARAPMGGYRIESLNGEMRVRLARPSDTFLGIGEKQPVSVSPGTVVYADEEKVCCHAWNHRDSQHTCLESNTEQAIFFADAVSTAGRHRAAKAIEFLAAALQESSVKVTLLGVLDRSDVVLTP